MIRREVGITGVSRRKVLLADGLGLVVAALDPLGVPRASAAPPPPPDPGGGPVTLDGGGKGILPESGAVTTLDATIVGDAGIPGGKGYRGLVVAGGEPHMVRAELSAIQSVPTVPLAAFVQLSDIHCIDDQSPMRVEWLDEHAHAGPPPDYLS